METQQTSSKEVAEIWALFRDTDKKIKELATRQEETDREIRGVNEGMKDLRELFTGQWGKLVEAIVEPSVLRLFQERGIQVIDTAQRLKTTRNGATMEIDILATNEDSVIPIEVKTTLKVEDVNYFIEKLSRFFEFFPKYKGMKLYGAVAGIRIEEAADRYADPSQAQDKGLFVLTLSGEGLVVILNDEKFKPKEW